MSKFIQIKAKIRLREEKSAEIAWKFFFIIFVEKLLLKFTSWILIEVYNHKHDVLLSPHIFTQLYY